jgi:hypothetical protein
LKNKHDTTSMVIYKFDITLCQVSIIFTVNRNGRIASRFMIVHPGDIVKEVIIVNPLLPGTRDWISEGPKKCNHDL